MATDPVASYPAGNPGARAMNRIEVTPDDAEVPLAFDAPGLDPRERDTLGPVLFESAPRRLFVRAADREQRGARCPRGALAELRIASVFPPKPLDTSEAASFAPPGTTFSVTPTHWVPAVAVNRYRPGTRPRPSPSGGSERR